MAETPESWLKRVMQTPPSDSSKELERIVRERQQLLRAKIDDACRRALESGTDGVRVTTYDFSNNVMIQITTEVPFGEIEYKTVYGNDEGV